MAKLYEQIDDRLTSFIARQHLFFVATAPTSADGHLNISPKGLDTFAIIDPGTVAYLDLTGSGVETIAHLRQNGRIVIMFCAFEGPPNIVRLHGKGEVIEPGDPAFPGLRERFPAYEGVRAVIRVQLERISDSCGFGVPRFQYEGDRSQLLDWYAYKGEEGLHTYRMDTNHHSIDGLSGLRGVTTEAAP